MSNARDQFAEDIYTADRLHKNDPVDLTTHYSYVIADELIAAGYRKIDHTEYALDHKLSDLQFTDDDGELWTDEEDVKDYASEYGDSMTLVQRHVTEWEPVK